MNLIFFKNFLKGVGFDSVDNIFFADVANASVFFKTNNQGI